MLWFHCANMCELIPAAYVYHVMFILWFFFFFLPSWLWAVSGYCHLGSHTMSGKAKRNSKLTLSPSSCSTSPYVNISLAFVASPYLHIHAHVHITYSRSREIPRMFFGYFFLFFSFNWAFSHLSKSKLAKPNLSFILGSTAQPGWRGSAFVRSVLNI